MASQAVLAGSACGVSSVVKGSTLGCGRALPEASVAFPLCRNARHSLVQYAGLRQAGVSSRKEIQGEGLSISQAASVGKGLSSG